MNLSNTAVVSSFLNPFLDLFSEIENEQEDKFISKIETVVNVFETGKTIGGYDTYVVLKDGKNGTPQVTFGRSQTTEQGNLGQLIIMYDCLQGKYSSELLPYVAKMRNGISLVTDKTFKDLLIKAANEDVIMHQAQDEFFKQFYLLPAAKWFKNGGFTFPLSLLVIYDSFVHSGGILTFLRKKFAEKLPFSGGREKVWITNYVQVRKVWLRQHTNTILRKTTYRMQCFEEAIASNNWALEQPLKANGVLIK